MLYNKVVMHHIFLKRSHKRFVVAILQPHPVVNAGVVYHSIDTPKLCFHLPHCTFASCRFGKFCNYLEAFAASLFNFVQCFKIVFFVTTYDAQKVEQTIEKINEALKDKPVSKEIRQKLNYAKKNWPANLNKYEEQEKIMGEQRSSYSKTDNDATFMRMKEDHMGNGQLKPAYNVQISTNNQFIASYSLHQKTTDTNTLVDHLTAYETQLGQLPDAVTADAGYGSEQNYQWLEENNITGYVKHNQFDRQQNETIRDKKPFSTDKLFYNKEKDCYYCPMGQPMDNIATRTTATGFKQEITIYQVRSCEGCPLRGACHKGQGPRSIEVNHNLNRLKQKADELLLSEEGERHRKKRPCDVEPVFGNIKNNHHFKRFMLRGMEKVSVEMGLIALAHNLRKKAA